MRGLASKWAGSRGLALLAVAIPAVAGLAWMAAFGAPRAYLAGNAAALVVAAAWILLAHGPASLRTRRLVALVLLTLLFVPLVTGPAINGIARWLPLGPVTLHAGMLALPPLAILAAEDEAFAGPILLTVLLAASLQPDAATGFAVTFAAVGLHHLNKDWKIGAVIIVGFLASIAMALRGELPAQPFVERVLVEAALTHPLVGAGLLAALVAGFFLMLKAAPLGQEARFALAGSLFGFSTMALMSNYPSPLIGFGAAPILGYGFALGLRTKGPA